MTTLERFKKYFGLNELFSPDCAKRYGEFAWAFLRPELMEVLIWVREGIGKPIVINTKGMTQRGYRENTCELVAQKTVANKMYCSAHTLGAGVDFNIVGMSAESVRNWIRQNINHCPYPIRLERGVSWVHIDVLNIDGSKLKEFSE